MSTQKNRLNEHPKHMLKLMGKKYLQVYAQNFFYYPIIDGTLSDADVESRARKKKGNSWF